MFSKQSIASVLSMLISSTSAAGGYDYKTNGADWPGDFPDCGLTNQSPIDLRTEEGAYPTYNYQDDEFNKIYTDQQDSILIEWKNGYTTQVAVNKAGQDTQTFHSTLAEKVYGSGKRFTGVQFHFHAGSEHTIDGKRHDLEMHTVHLADETKNGFAYSAMGLMFSVNDHDSVSENLQKVIDKFFESMKWSDQNDPLVDYVPYGALMMEVDMNNRWVYKGSVTTPPCAQSVYWNVLRTIHPIKQEHMDLFNKQMERGANDLLKTGTFREIQPIDLQNVIVVTRESTTAGIAWLSVLVALMAVLVVSIILYIFSAKNSKK